jgi:RNase P protein component
MNQINSTHHPMTTPNTFDTYQSQNNANTLSTVGTEVNFPITNAVQPVLSLLTHQLVNYAVQHPESLQHIANVSFNTIKNAASFIYKSLPSLNMPVVHAGKIKDPTCSTEEANIEITHTKNIDFVYGAHERNSMKKAVKSVLKKAQDFLDADPKNMLIIYAEAQAKNFNDSIFSKCEYKTAYDFYKENESQCELLNGDVAILSKNMLDFIEKNYGQSERERYYSQSLLFYVTADHMLDGKEIKTLPNVWSIYDKIHGEIPEEMKKLVEDKLKICYSKDGIWNIGVSIEDMIEISNEASGTNIYYREAYVKEKYLEKNKKTLENDYGKEYVAKHVRQFHFGGLQHQVLRYCNIFGFADNLDCKDAYEAYKNVKVSPDNIDVARPSKENTQHTDL